MMKFETSPSRDALCAAKAQAFTEIQNAVKNAKNPHFKNEYADLPEVLDTIRPVFAKYGLCLDQWPVTDVHQPGPDADPLVLAGCITEVKHASGQWERCTLLLPVSKADPQGVGSAITYARRYAAQGAAGIAAEQDDDANAASGGKAGKKAKAPAAKATPESVVGLLEAATTEAELNAARAAFAKLDPAAQNIVMASGAVAKAKERVAAGPS